MLNLVTICCKLLKVRLLPDRAISSTVYGKRYLNFETKKSEQTVFTQTCLSQYEDFYRICYEKVFKITIQNWTMQNF